MGQLAEKHAYRRDIDGLRGIAVAMVLLYHASPALMPAGFVGVDVFFVISGFLIVRLLIDDIDRGTFSFTAFLERRMRRILPALVLVVAATLACGYLVLGPTDYRRLAQSVLALSVAAPNMYFWRNDDYFARSIPEHPLLHTWSLGVEEQFYLVVPLFLLLISRFSAQTRIVWLVLGVLGSLFASVLWTGQHPAATFYLLPARGWELLLGGLVALAAPPSGRTPLVAEATSVIGLAAIGVAALQFGAATQYPGLAAALPCLGAAAVIWASRSRRTVAAMVLSNPVLVSAGLISYSLYLWHWPVLTLLRHALDREIHTAELIAACTSIVALSYITWRFVETPFRSRAALPSSRGWWLSTATAMTVLVACGAQIVASQGLPGRLPATAIAYEQSARDRPPNTARCHHGSPELVTLEQLCIFHPDAEPSAILVWGDSHANALVPVLEPLAAAYDTRLVQASYSACPPVLGIDIAYMSTAHRCREFNDLVARSLQSLGVTRVILAASWSGYVRSSGESRLSAAFDLYSAKRGLGGPDTPQRLMEGLQETVRALDAQGVEVWIVRQVPLHPRFVPNSLAMAVAQGRDPQGVGIALTDHRANQSAVDEIFAALPARARFLDPAASLCEGGFCVGGVGGTSFYVDNNHLSVHGAARLADVLRPVLEGASESSPIGGSR